MRQIIVVMGDFPDEVWEGVRDAVDDLVNDNTAGMNAKIYADGDISLASLMVQLIHVSETLYGES